MDNDTTVNPINDSNSINTNNFPVMDKNILDATVNKLIDSVSKSINVDCTVKPRSSVNGGTKQLKLKNRTKGNAPSWDKKQSRAFKKVTKAIGEQHQANIMKAWNNVRKCKTKKQKEKTLIGDGIIITLYNLSLTKHQITSMIDVGGPRLNRIKDSMNGLEVVHQPRKRAQDATQEDIERMVAHMVKKDLEPGYPCQHRKVPLYVVGDNQGSTWIDLHKEYVIECKKNGWRDFSCNRFREYIQHHIPGIKLNKVRTDLCNTCFSIALKLKDPTIPEEEKDELREQQKIHMKEANIQRRAMNAFIEAIKKEKAPDDPPLRFEPCYIPDVQDQILEEAIELKKDAKHPMFDDEDEDDTEVPGSPILDACWAQAAKEDGMRNGACSNKASSPHPTPQVL